MIAVIFEVEPHDQFKENYLETAANLRKELEAIKGFISVERFQSLTNEKKLLSLSFFEHEDAVIEWRNRAKHRQAQAAGQSYFKGYRLRVAHVLRDYGKEDRGQAPEDAQV